MKIKNKLRTKRKLPRWAVGTSLTMTLGGLILLFMWPSFLKDILYNFTLTPDSYLYHPWKKTPMPLAVDFYFFNWTNPEDVYDGDIKPNFKEVGPFRYSEIYEKANITWNKNGTVTYRQLHFWHFNKEEGNGDLQQKINIINPVLSSAVYLAKSWNYYIRRGLSISLSGVASTINITKAIDELLFKGYSDPLISLANSMPFLAGKLPDMDKFGFYYKRNGSVMINGIFNMGTGVKNTKLGKLYNWNYNSNTSHYEDKCNKIEGSTGDFFETESNFIRFYQPSACRTLTLTFVGKHTVEKIEGNKYVLDAHTFDNGTLYPENKCYCNGECIPSGMLNVSSCNYNSPFFISLPHFYNADPYYGGLVDGLKPEKKKHEFFITLEPTTNMVLEVKATMQLNLLLQPIPGITLFENVPKAFFPLMWSQTTARIPSEEASKLRLLLITPYILASTGIAMLVAALSLLIYVRYKSNASFENEHESLYEKQLLPVSVQVTPKSPESTCETIRT